MLIDCAVSVAWPLLTFVVGTISNLKINVSIFYSEYVLIYMWEG